MADKVVEEKIYL